MMLTSALLLAASLSTGDMPLKLVTRSGEIIPIDGAVEIRKSNVVFRHRNGTLYSIPLSELDLDRDTSSEAALLRESTGDLISSARIRVPEETKQQLLDELSRNRSGSMPRLLPPAPSTSSAPEAAGSSVNVGKESDEWYWRNEARRLEENVRRAREELELTVNQAQVLEDKIRSLLSLGYHPNQFSLDVLRLDNARNSLDRLKLQIVRAERALAQFRDDARRQDILPGWLR